MLDEGSVIDRHPRHMAVQFSVWYIFVDEDYSKLHTL